MYLMFMGPYEEGGDWSDEGIVGIDRLVNRVWRLVQGYVRSAGNPHCEDNELLRVMHSTIKNVREDTEFFKFNTALSRIMEYVNAMYKAQEAVAQENLENLALILAPFAPHFCEEVWSVLGNEPSIFQQTIPEYDETLLQVSTVNIVVQVNGKVRDNFEIAADSSEDEIKEAALSLEKIQKYLNGKELEKTIIIPGRLVNLVVN